MMRLLLLLAVCAVAATARKSYDGYRLYEITPRTAEQVELLKNVRETFADSVMFEDDIPSAGYSMDVLASPNAKDIIRNLMRQADIQYTIRRENIQDFIDAERERMSHKQAYDPNDYNTYADIQAELQRLSTVCPAGFSCQIRTLGLSTLGNEINAIAISESGQSDKEVMWIDSLIHAREWIAGTSIMRTAAELIEGYGSNPEATELLDGYDFVILPVFNPDGYIHAWEEDRFWRKSRNVNEGSNCIGTDLNRNHQYAWGEQPGASTNPCFDTYMGSGPASEPEVSTVELAIQSLAASRSVAIVMSVHTAAEAWLMPYGNEVDNVCAIPADYDDMLQVGQAAVDAVVEAGGDEWRLGGACETLYAATGITCDFAYAIAGVKYSYTPELKGPSFDPEPDQIEPAFQEFFAAVVASVREREIIEFGASRK